MSETSEDKTNRKHMNFIKGHNPPYRCSIRFSENACPKEVLNAFKIMRHPFTKLHKGIGLIWYLRRLRTSYGEVYPMIQIFSTELLNVDYVKELVIKHGKSHEDFIHDVLAQKWSDDNKEQFLNNEEMKEHKIFKEFFDTPTANRFARTNQPYLSIIHGSHR